MGKTKVIVTVHRPELTPEEYERRLNRVKRAAERVLIDLYRAEAQEKREKEDARKNAARSKQKTANLEPIE